MGYNPEITPGTKPLIPDPPSDEVIFGIGSVATPPVAPPPQFPQQ